VGDHPFVAIAQRPCPSITTSPIMIVATLTRPPRFNLELSKWHHASGDTVMSLETITRQSNQRTHRVSEGDHMGRGGNF